MSDTTVTAAELRTGRWRNTIHEHITPIPFSVDPVAEEAAGEVSRRYQESVTSERLPLELVADAVNRLDSSDLPAPVRLLLGQPHVLVVALERAQSEDRLDADTPDRSVLDVVEDRTYPEFVDALVDLVTRPDAATSLVRELGLEPGDVPRDDLVRRLRSQEVDIREGHLTESLGDVLRQVRDHRGPEKGPAEDVAAEATREPATASSPRITGAGEDAAHLDRGRRAPESGHGSLPPDLWGVDCHLEVPVDDEAPRPRGDLLVVALTIIRLYLLSERRPLFAAMDALREQALSSDLLNPLDDPYTTADDSDRGQGIDAELCDVRLASYSWNHEFDPLTLRKRANVAAVVGVRDPARTVPVNTDFARALDQLVDVLAASGTDPDRWPPTTVRAVATDVSLQLAGAFRSALTGQVLLDLALWRRQFKLASTVFRRPALRRLFGVGDDPEQSLAPLIRKVLPSARFDAAGLHREGQALGAVLELARRLTSNRSLPDTILASAVAGAVTLQALRGRLRVPGLPTAAREPVHTR